MSFIKDSATGIVINTDDNYYKSILLTRQQQKQAREVCSELDQVKDELAQIKSLMEEILNGRKHGQTGS